MNYSCLSRILTKSVLQSVTFKRSINIKKLEPPPSFAHVEFPERVKLPMLPKVPTYAPGLAPPKMMRNINWMRGPELVHNTLMYQQYGIQANHGGRLHHRHLELIRFELTKKLDYTRMFAVWRVDAPYQACTKRPVGITLGGGKGSNIHHYVTPVKAHRIIVEVGGLMEYDEVEDILQKLADRMPFKARAVSHEMLQLEEKTEANLKAINLNRYTMEYVIKNNLGGCHQYIKKIDLQYFGKYL